MVSVLLYPVLQADSERDCGIPASLPRKRFTVNFGKGLHARTILVCSGMYRPISGLVRPTGNISASVDTTMSVIYGDNIGCPNLFKSDSVTRRGEFKD